MWKIPPIYSHPWPFISSMDFQVPPKAESPHNRLRNQIPAISDFLLYLCCERDKSHKSCLFLWKFLNRLSWQTHRLPWHQNSPFTASKKFKKRKENHSLFFLKHSCDEMLEILIFFFLCEKVDLWIISSLSRVEYKIWHTHTHNKEKPDYSVRFGLRKDWIHIF